MCYHLLVDKNLQHGGPASKILFSNQFTKNIFDSHVARVHHMT